MNFFKKIFGGGPDLSELISQGALIVDVRTPSEYKLSLIHISEPTRPY